MFLGERAKGFVSARLLEQISGMVEEGRADSLARLFDTISKLAPARYHREFFRNFAEKVCQDDPIIAVFRRIFSGLHPNCRAKLIMDLLVNFGVLGRGIGDWRERELGIHVPNFGIISPTMRCNLRCRGCYASEYDPSIGLSFDEIDKLIEQGKELGMSFFTFSGGECFVLPDRLVRLGNVAPMISVEGGREESDARR